MRVSEYYKLNRTQAALDFVDVRLDTDIPVFLDPSAIKTLESAWGQELASLLQSFFSCVLNYIKSGKNSDAQRLLGSLSERNEYHLGYSRGKSEGHAFGSKTAGSVWAALSESNASVTGLLEDLEDTCLLIEGIGADMISDAVSNILRGPLIAYTQSMCEYYDIPMEEGVASGPMWDPLKKGWESKFLKLPVASGYGKVILVPKLLVRQSLSYKVSDYYRHYLLPEMQQAELKSGGSLIEVLKNGTRRVTKKALMKKYGFDKPSIIQSSIKHPDALSDYRIAQKDKKNLPLSNEVIAEIEGAVPTDWSALKKELLAVPTGKAHADNYEKVIEKIFTSLFYPSLCHPTKQKRIHDGRKRIDITYTNEGNEGFFYWIGLHHPSAFIFVECKNYDADVGNPEIDQLSGRFSGKRGQVGILACRKISDKKKLGMRCRDTANDDRGFIIYIDDQDVCELIDYQSKNSLSVDFPLLRSKFSDLIS